MSERLPKPHPGEVLRHDFMIPKWSKNLAERLGPPSRWTQALLDGRVRVTPELAPGLAEATRTSPEFWMRVQQFHDRDQGPHPGAVLLWDFLVPEQEASLRMAYSVPEEQTHALVRGTGRVDEKLARVLGSYFRTSHEFWLRLQVAYDQEVAAGHPAATASGAGLL